MNKKQTQKVAYLSTFFSLYIAQAVPMSFFYYGTASYYARTSSVAIRYWIATNNKTAMDIKSVLVASNRPLL